MSAKVVYDSTMAGMRSIDVRDAKGTLVRFVASVPAFDSNGASPRVWVCEQWIRVDSPERFGGLFGWSWCLTFVEGVPGL